MFENDEDLKYLNISEIFSISKIKYIKCLKMAMKLKYLKILKIFSIYKLGYLKGKKRKVNGIIGLLVWVMK